jgi:hypothetical protein
LMLRSTRPSLRRIHLVVHGFALSRNQPVGLHVHSPLTKHGLKCGDQTPIPYSGRCRRVAGGIKFPKEIGAKSEDVTKSVCVTGARSAWRRKGAPDITGFSVPLADVWRLSATVGHGDIRVARLGAARAPSCVTATGFASLGGVESSCGRTGASYPGRLVGGRDA